MGEQQAAPEKLALKLPVLVGCSVCGHVASNLRAGLCFGICMAGSPYRVVWGWPAWPQHSLCYAQGPHVEAPYLFLPYRVEGWFLKTFP